MAEVTAGSNAFVVTVAVTVAVPAGAAAGYGPHSDGTANQPPASRCRRTGV